jgi:cytoskeletal protein CcmA (bactofilin family)
MEKLIIDYDNFSLISRDSHITGTLELKGTSHIYSSVTGNIFIDSTSDLFIEEGAKIIGNIQCHDIDVHGEVQGNIISTGKVSFYSTAIFKGDLKSKYLSIAPGAKLEMSAESTI